MTAIEPRVEALEEHARSVDQRFSQYDAVLERVRVDAGETRERTAVLESRLDDIRTAVTAGFTSTSDHLTRQDSRMDAFIQTASDAQGRAYAQWPASAQIAVSPVALLLASVVGALAAWGLGLVHL